MAAIKFFNLLAISTLALLACSFNASPVNALTTERHHVGRGLGHAHEGIAKRKRDTPSKRCKARSSSPPPAPASTSAPKPASSSSAKPHPSSSSSSPKPAATSGGGSSNSGDNSGVSKVGMAWPNGDQSGLEDFRVKGKQQYIYTWDVSYPSTAKKLGFIPCVMLWGDAPDKTAAFKKAAVKGYANVAMGMNEPNEKGQSNISPQQGIQLWQQYIQPLAKEGYTLVSPAPSSRPNGFDWVHQFIDDCTGCTIDVVAVHWYDNTVQKFKDYVNKFHDGFGKKMWITEFACQNFNNEDDQCSKDEIFSFMSEVTSWMDGLDFVEAYFAFGAMKDLQGVNPLDALMSSSGGLTDLGKLYLGA